MPKTLKATSCPFCGSVRSRVTHTQHEDTFNRQAGRMTTTTRRRRVCLSCDLPFITREEVIPEEFNGSDKDSNHRYTESETKPGQ